MADSVVKLKRNPCNMWFKSHTASSIKKGPNIAQIITKKICQNDLNAIELPPCSGVTYMKRVSGTLQLRSASTRFRSLSPILELRDSHGILRRCRSGR